MCTAVRGHRNGLLYSLILSYVASWSWLLRGTVSQKFKIRVVNLAGITHLMEMERNQTGCNNSDCLDLLLYKGNHTVDYSIVNCFWGLCFNKSSSFLRLLSFLSLLPTIVCWLLRLNNGYSHISWCTKFVNNISYFII